MEDISDIVTEEFYKQFSKGQVLGFDQDGTLMHYKIVRLDKRRKIVKIKPLKLYTEQELREELGDAQK